MANYCPADAPCADRVALAETGDAYIAERTAGEWWLGIAGIPRFALLYCPWCGGRLVETAPTRCICVLPSGGCCTSTATHGPDGKAIACWLHAGNWPEVIRG